jgi:uncharacterized protein (TIGR00251 family)
MQRIKIKVITRAKRNQIVGWQDDVLKIRITDAPVAGRANEMLLDFLAKKWQVARSEIKIIRGLKSKNKILEIGTNIFFGDNQ